VFAQPHPPGRAGVVSAEGSPDVFVHFGAITGGCHSLEEGSRSGSTSPGPDAAQEET